MILLANVKNTASSFTAWNPSDKSSNIILGGSNLNATCNSNSDGGVRAVSGKTSGKWYFEITCTSVNSGDTGVGIASDLATLTAIGNVADKATLAFRSGSMYNNGTFIRNINALGLNGLTVANAVDLDNKTNFLKVLTGGASWNGNSADPASNTGGVDISGYFTGGRTIFPVVCLGNTSDNVTANFGASAFVGTVPSGFTAGWS